MRILQLSLKPPFPSVDGGCIAIRNMAENLMELGHSLKILTVSTHKHPFLANKFPDRFLKDTAIDHVPIDTSLRFWDALKSLLRTNPYNVDRFFSPAFNDKVQAELLARTYDLVILESLFMAPYLNTIRKHSDARVVLRSHNLEFMIWERQARNTQPRHKKLYLKILARQLKKYEVDLFNQLDGLMAISSTDQRRYEILGFKRPLLTVPLSVDTENPEVPQPSENPRFFHIGAMDWKPNQEAISWLLEKVWPLVLKQAPGAELYLAGRNFDTFDLTYIPKGVRIVGEVDSARDFIRKHQVMVVPVLSAGGIRIKIIEGMSMGKAVISTPMGAEGIDAESGASIMIAKKPADFARHMLDLYEHPEKAYRLGISAQKYAQAHFGGEKIRNDLQSFFREIGP